jgi:hypothetical protein
MENTTICSSPSTFPGKPVRVCATMKIPTYGCRVQLVVAEQFRREVERLLKKYKLDPLQGEVEGMVVHTAEIYHILIDLKYLTHNTLAHELYHAVNRVTGDRGIEEEEARAWLAGHLAEFVYKTLEKKKLTVKHG